ncbi:protoheme IX farnesyltransferase [Segniliparus rotundus DSM 44985]|uniref:Protoheme IX farnesyltransferase n=1 Tax=Segniliparus rotundus (strain ATCC BAA-972 / CDC 1076 / CIP 108378 / DSM 44985 / JCM 13578) TaxID=640132 RepID=D6ZBX8_SEGRD|nr:protoheme IX farnesyltransferase [Segniliparus rotundus DSM 44985]
MPVSADPVERGVSAPSLGAGRVLALARDYLALTKPRVIELLLVATIPVMLLAHRGTVDLRLILETLFGGWLGAASANTLNCVVDADIDKVMDRTKNRPLARGAMSRRAALLFGLGLGSASFLWLWRSANLLAASLVVATIAFYVLVYSMFLKRRTSQNVVWGGAAGCMPALVGWAAVTGSLDWPALVVFMVIFFWTPPHTWSLAMKYRDDYSTAGVPMLPTVADERLVAKRMVWYTWATVLTTFALIPVVGLLYAGVAIAAGSWFLYEAHRLSAGLAAGRPVTPFRLFLQSNNYLAAVFVGLAVDSALAWPTVASLLS